MTARTWRGTGMLVALALTACGAAACDSATRTASGPRLEACEAPEALAVLPAELYEASGLTRDPTRPDIFWAHNDSGNDAVLYAVDLAGKVVATAPVAETQARDLEDLATGPCASGGCLYLADIGDNLAVREFIEVHVLPIPALPEAPSGGRAGTVVTLPVVPEATWRLVYPGGARDAESLAVDAERKELVVVTKGRDGEIAMYVKSLRDLRDRPETPDTLERVGRLRLPIGSATGQFVTAADLSPDGSLLAVRSYTTLYQFAWDGSATFDTTLSPGWLSLISAREAQGEGMSWDLSGEVLVLVSEGRGGIPPSISRVRCPR